MAYSERFGRSLNLQAARRVAIDSVRNIADASAALASVEGNGVEDDDETAPDGAIAGLATVLRDAGTPLLVKEVAERSGWSSDVVADALSRGGKSGVFEFREAAGGKTKVQLAVE